jgi:PAS domain S-box-containing protein
MYCVLYVDDEPDLLELAKVFLEQSPDFHVDVQISAKAALTSPQIMSCDAIISDYQMPEMDGIAFLKEVRAKLGNIPFILFTGRGREEVVIEAINNGVDFYLQKGGDVMAQFAELSHKIRQSVARRTAERSLIESEKRLADIIDFLPDATLAIDKSGTVIAWNKAIEEMTGVPAASIIGKGDHEYALPFYGERRPILIDLVFLPDEELIRRFYSIVKKEGAILVAETTLPHPRGEAKTLSGTASILYDKEGNVAGAIESIRDISGRKKSEDELRAAYEQITASEEELREQVGILEESERKIRESEARLRYMIGFYEKAKAPQQDLLGYAVEGAGAITGSTLGYLAFLNDDESELTIYAWSKSAMKECSLRDKPIIYRTDKTGLWGEAVRQRRAVITNDYTAPNPAKKGYPKGHPAIVRHMNVPIIDDGHVVLVAGVANKPGDYTEDDIRELTLLMQSLWLVIKRQRTEEALRESEEKYRDLFENSVLGIFRTTPEGKFSTLNTSFARIAGYETVQEMLAAISDVRTQLYVHDSDRDRFLSALTADGNIKGFEAQFYHKDGHPVWIIINATTVRDAAGTVLYYEGTIEDITEQKKAEQALEQEKIFSDAVVDSVPGLLYLYNAEGRMIRWNKAHETITGYSPEELAGMNVLDWFRNDEAAITTITDGVKKALREGYATAEADLQTKCGEKIPFFFTAQRLEIDGKTYFTGVGIDITERRKVQGKLQTAYEQITASEEELREQVDALIETERQVKESEEKYRSLVELSPIAVIVHRDRKLIYANPESIRLVGANSLDDVIGSDILSFIHPDYHLRAAEHFRLLNEEEKTIPLQEEVLLTIDGKPFTVEVTAKPLLYQNLPSILVVFRDITERKKSEMELQAAYEQLTASNEELQGQYEELAKNEQRIRASEEQFRNVIEFSPFGMHFYDLREDGSLVFTGANPAADTILDVDHRQFVGKTIEEAFPDLVDTEVPDQYRRVARTGDPWHMDQVIYDEGEIRGAFAVTAFRIRSDVMTAVFFDITERKKAEVALREKTEELYRNFINTIQDGFVRADPQSIIVMASPSAAVMLGYDSADQLLGMSMTRLYYRPEVRRKLLDQIANHNQISDFEAEFIRNDGTVFWVSINAQAFHDENGKMIGTEVFIHDITDRRSMEHAIREANRKLNLLNSITRHDVVNQLTTLQGFIQIVSMKKTDPVIADYLEKIGNVAETINRQIEFTRTYQELGIKVPAWFRVRDVITKAESQVPVHFSGTCLGVEIFADPMLERVFFNLFDNAGRHGARVTEITVRCERDPDGFVIIVEDNGEGVPLNEKDKIFERGFGKHSGLGLFLVREILAITNITIKETGIPGHGARFEMLVPKGSYRLVKPN